MREPARDKGRLQDILDAIGYVEQFVEGLSYEEFVADKRTYFAIVKNVEIVGEAAYMLSFEFKEQHQELPWDAIIKMRHVLVHGYATILPSILWQTVHEDLNPVKNQVKIYLENFD